MENTLSIECLMEAVSEYNVAKTERDEGRGAYRGLSWGWHGRFLEDAVAQRAAEVKKHLQAIVREIVREELAEGK